MTNCRFFDNELPGSEYQLFASSMASLVLHSASAGAGLIPPDFSMLFYVLGDSEITHLLATVFQFVKPI